MAINERLLYKLVSIQNPRLRFSIQTCRVHQYYKIHDKFKLLSNQIRNRYNNLTMSMKCGNIEQCSRSKSKGNHKTGAKQTRTST